MGHIMRLTITSTFILLTLPTLCFSQTRQCSCPTDSFITQYTSNCKTIYLRDSSKLYYQFNCDSIWLTLENPEKHIVFSMTTEFYAYTFRLGYHFAKEYDKYLLFRSGCPANGPCNFVLVDKQNGKTIKELYELIYDHESEKFYDFLIYFTDSSLSSLTLDFIDKNKSYKIPVNPRHFNAIIPQYQFDKILLKNNILTLEYNYDKDDKWTTEKIQWATKKIQIDLKKYAP